MLRPFDSELAQSALIVASSHDAIVGMNPAGVITSCNPAAARMFGLPAAKVIGQVFAVFVTPDCREMEAAILLRILGGAEVAQYRSERIGHDGTVTVVSTSSSPIITAGGRIIGAATVSRKLSDLQQSRERFEVRVNQHRTETQHAAERLEIRVGLQRAEARGAADRFEIQVDLERSQASDAAERFEVQVDEERVIAEHAQQVSEARIDAERLEIKQDIDHLQGQLQQSQRLEVLGQLAGGVAHDFNNLLAVILNYAAFVVEELAAGRDGDLEAAGRDVAQIQRAAQRATSLTHQLLAFARREVVQPRVIDLNDVVNEVQQLLDRTIGEDVVLCTNLGAGLWPVLADTGQIEQVLVNLAVNARDAMTGGGVLTIDTANVELGADVIPAGSPARAGRHVRLRVGDNGTGMAPEVMAHVFEPFYTTKADGTGTGLGLATVYGIVVQADATIDIQSRPGVGTTFTIMVPVTDEVAVPVLEKSAYRHAATGETILVVEDEEALREVTERIFTRSGYRVLTAAHGAEALALAAAHDGPIDLLVTDVVMPNMLGKEVAERMQLLRPDIEVLYMSGYAQPVLASRGRLDRDVNLIEKPFSAATLVEQAGHILSDKKA
jgi:PAS domain S-box-containing protein